MSPSNALLDLAIERYPTGVSSKIL